MTIADQLLTLDGIKTDIKDSIEAKGQVVGAAPFASYAGFIDAISTGGTATSTPVLSVYNETGYFGSFLKPTLTNWGSYGPLLYYVALYNSADTLLSDNITNPTHFTLASGQLSYSGPVEFDGAYYYKLRVQEYDKTISAEVRYDFTRNIPTGRYWRIDYPAATDNLMWAEWFMYTGATGTGTQLPSYMTSYTAPTPFVASTNAENASYQVWKMFDSNANSQWWTLGIAGDKTTFYGQIDLGASYAVKSFRLRSSSFNPGGMRIRISDTGAFTGEETIVVPTTAWVFGTSTLKIFN